MRKAERNHHTKGTGALRKKIGAEHGAQAKAARLLEIEEPRLSRILRGKLGCPLDLALKIEKHFGIPARWWVIPADEAA